MKKILLLFSLIFLSIVSFGQTTKGKDFWFGYIENHFGDGIPEVYISAENDVTGVIEIPGLGFTQSFSVLGGGITQSYILPSGSSPPYNEGNHNLAVHITSCDSITVYAVNSEESYSTDATLIYPKTSLGNDYTILNMTGGIFNQGDAVTIVATEDNTDIEITPSVNTDGGQQAGVPFTITLNQGEMYQLIHTSYTDDLTGTTVRGVNTSNCLPFAVFSGSNCTNIGYCAACDHLYEQLLPNSKLGQTYAAIPHALKNSTHYRVMATQNNTDIFIDGAWVTTLNTGDFYQYADNNYSIIEASSPIAVMQYAEGWECGGPGDPFQVLLNPIEQSVENINFNAFQSTLFNDYWVNILVKTANVPDITLDGTNIAGDFTPFPSNAAYSYARVNTWQGDHTLFCPGGALATVYGWGNAVSFGYSAGAALKNLTDDFEIISSPACINDLIDFSAVPDTLASGFSWNFGDGSAPVNGQNVSHSYNNPGTYNVTLTKIMTNGCDVNIVKQVNIVNLLPIAIDQNDTTICAGTTLDLEIPLNAPFEVEQVNDCGDTVTQLMSANYDTLYWSTGESGSSIQITPISDTTIYAYGENYNSTCTAIDSIVIIVSAPQASFNTNPSQGNAPLDVTFTNTSSPATTYDWDFGNGYTNSVNDQSTQNNTYTEEGTYIITLTISEGNCSDQASQEVIVNILQLLSYELPNVFTPNNDGINDYFSINAVNAVSIEMIILNRWGNVVFETETVGQTWNGQVNNIGAACTDGTYFYKFKITGVDGVEIEEHGFVQLVRDTDK